MDIHSMRMFLGLFLCLLTSCHSVLSLTDGRTGVDLMNLVREQRLTWKTDVPSKGGANSSLLSLIKSLGGNFTLYFSLLEVESVFNFTVFGVYSENKTLPGLEILSDVGEKSRLLAVRYQGRKSYQRITFPLPHVTFHKIMLWVTKEKIGLVIDCAHEIIKTLPQQLSPLSANSFVTLGIDRHGENKFQGVIQETYLFPQELDIRPWSCDPDNNDMLGDSPSIESESFQVSRVENQVSELIMMVNMLKSQNKDLLRRVVALERCECRPQCSVNGSVLSDGQVWQTDDCTTCVCKNGFPKCSRRNDLDKCNDMCELTSCEHGGSCISLTDQDVPQCTCKAPYMGESCQVRSNPCVWPLDTGQCNEAISRFYYDRITQECLPFLYTGCGGNMNNYETIKECESVTLSGACCYRQLSTSTSSNQNESQTKGSCKRLTLAQCKGIHRVIEGDLLSEVVSFYPSMECDEAACFQNEQGCSVDNAIVKEGEVLTLRCLQCTCQSTGLVTCQCTSPSKRRELRTMSRDEIETFHRGVIALHQSGAWEEFRDLYMSHSMQSNGGPLFLTWNRMFLYRMETKLKEFDCNITLPYYDFSTDAGNLQNSIIWQPNFFGGDGEGPLNCAPDHPFRNPKLWLPCLRRKFNRTVLIPSVTELILSLQSEDFNEMSGTLEAFSGYLHTYIGGDMATAAAAYDPVFYLVHTFIDHLYWKWQQLKSSNKFKFPAVFGNVAMIPFGIAPKDILDMETVLCVSYEETSHGHVCNISLTPPRVGNNGFVEDSDGYDVYGYDRHGLDRRAFDRHGFNKDGYNRDGYCREGLDKAGYDRLGFNREGYDRFGYNLMGQDKHNNLDTSDRELAYHTLCLLRTGVTAEGYDQYGFSVEGYDVNYCNFSYHGPFSPIQSFRVWHLLLNQSPTFIKSLPRLCPAVRPLPQQWLNQFWMDQPYDVTGRVPVEVSTEALSGPTSEFCVDTDSIVTPCPCEEPSGRCEENLCLSSDCPSYPEALCTIDFCGGCKAQWSVNGLLVNCQQQRDYCEPNPCKHGGVCVVSVWSGEPQLVTCQCPPGYDGNLCQFPALQVCQLPVSLGKCIERLTRWYFNPRTSSCEEFIYTGCYGNANNFVSFKACRNICMIGACCSRLSRMPDSIHGYDLQGYDRYGFNDVGLNQNGDKSNVHVAMAAGSNLYHKNGFDWRGFDQSGYDVKGLDAHGYNRSGFSRDGFNISGYNVLGEFDGIIDYRETGYDKEGFNRAGFNCYGYNRDDLDYEGLVGGYRYECRHTTLQQCQQLEEQIGEVVQFSPGQRCHQVNCQNNCGCNHYNTTLKFGEQFQHGCQLCVCNQRGLVECQCSVPLKRMEIRDMTSEELELFQNAVKHLSKGYQSKWFDLSELYSRYKPQFSGTSGFLPWNRYFLRTVEQQLQSYNCKVTIPYFDWTMDVGDMEKSRVWAANVFGGDSHHLNSCVQFHPFKDKFPPYWTPCLRRRFNASLHLVDSVDIEHLLRVPSYDSFRLRIELMSSLFQVWGGGHMITDHAPYDPAFLAHLAFLDKLWHDWQHREQDNILKYPAAHRYVLLSPFAINADSVLDSENQMCIRYIPVGLGLPCNSTVPVFSYDKEGFDRHGYDREGYDLRGFNQSGYNKQGEFDLGNVYNINGFDFQGFGRSGYDQNGIDRYGFVKTTFNSDGFDIDGFDQTGHDRYGFDRAGVTSFGFLRNNTDLIEANQIGPQIFDSFGFNRFGHNRFGFDREGYDIFGYDASGLNRANCQHYSKGKIFMIIKRSMNQKLKGLDENDLRLVVRVCPGASKIPEWIFTRNWLHRANQISVSRQMENSLQQQRIQSDPSARTISGRNENIWIPQAPDNRFCFVTYQYSECPLGQPPVTCPNELCQERSCPGHPEVGCWTRGCRKCYPDYYDGISGRPINCTGCVDNEGKPRQDNETWQTSKCRICKCQRGNVGCEKIDCPPAPCQYPIQTKGQCCPSCNGCYYGRKIYKDNSTILSKDSTCGVCECYHGNVTCVPNCPDIHNCLKPTVVEGECCPLCLDCKGHENGVEWQERPCLTCICQAEERECRKLDCPELPCAHPYTPQDQCCPICLGCYYDGVVYKDGEEFQPSACEVCLCNQGDVNCTTLTCPPVTCPNPIHPPELCCPVCDAACEYEGTIFRHGEVFNPSYDPCLNCSCINSIVRCVAIRCPPLKLTCQNPIRIPGKCCPQECQKCSQGGRFYDHGEIWTPDDTDCRICECREGLMSCRVNEVCGLECSHGVLTKAECCSHCTDCLYDGRVIPNGRYFSRPGYACQQCRCRHGNIQCEVVDICPRLPCTKTEMVPGTCCPICKGCQHAGRFIRHNAMVPSPNSCTDCTCVEGEVDCQPKPCPSVTCNDPQVIEGECCPICHQCLYEEILYDDGDRFIPQRNPCYRCTCSGGQVKCSEKIECDQPQCTHPARVVSKCCPLCEHCDFERRRFLNNQMFTPPNGDPCQICTCKLGSVACETIECSPVNCANAFIPPGHCCETCPPACRHQGQNYGQGEEFNDPRNKCNTCICQDGEVSCREKTCPNIPCTHPGRAPGDCCPTCNFCVHDRRLFRNGHSFRHPSDKCQDCTCQDGSVRCNAHPCPSVTCTDPYLEMGYCCPQCPPEICEFQGQQYQQGQRFLSFRDSCERCVCERGHVSCQRSPCPPVSCTHPVKGECCPSCHDCLFYGQSLSHGKTVRNPYSRCEECTCLLGNITCEQGSCSPVSCQHPAPLDCCPSCRQCLYRDRQYREGQRFPDVTGVCKECACNNGTVTCGKVTCGANLPCQNPAMGDCCLECNDCEFFDRRYTNGHMFDEPTNECKVCFCENGNIDCQDKPCPDVNCRHPVQGQCCPECRDCLYNNQQFSENTVFPHESDDCQECSCHGGNVLCNRKQCPNTLCSHPQQGDCCERCSDCSYYHRSFTNGAVFEDPQSPCRQCECVDGNVNCQTKPCPQVSCSNPGRGECCPHCHRCLYKGIEYADQQGIRDDTQPCSYCQCKEGSVECKPQACSTTSCEYPVMGQCCPECDRCLYRQIEYSNRQQFPDPTNPCQNCQCRNGDVVCQDRPCPSAICSHPVQGQCCEQCDDCLYQGTRRRNNLVYTDPDDNCKICQCIRGNVICRKRVCPPVSCRNPVQGECCRECSACVVNEKRYEIGEGYRDSCDQCTCVSGNMDCQPRQCPPVPCKHPVQGECCPQCTDCFYEGLPYTNKESFVNVRNECEECQCLEGTVRCQALQCPYLSCRHPVQRNCCATCDDCTFNGLSYQNRQIFEDPNSKCNECQCLDGTVTCQAVQCPPLLCKHPVQRDCCAACDDCHYYGLSYQNGQDFEDTSDKCRQCQCLDGTVRCQASPCPPVTCRHPTQGQCCPECTSCIYNGVSYENRQEFGDPDDQCQLCQCVDRRVECKRKSCPPVSCSHPVHTDCCSECSDCFYNQQVIRSGANFLHHSDTCQTCICLRGTVKCRRKECPLTYCTHPIQGQCCLECSTGCLYDNTELESGESFISDCQTCLCVKGNVQCEQTPCPVLTCLHPVRHPHQCCRECDQCFYNGRQFTNGQVFGDPMKPCQECKCQDGTVSCSKRSCPPVTCSHPVQGQCCPLCDADCFYDNRRISQGASFPNHMNQCESCSCEGGSVACTSKKCPPPPCDSPALDNCGCGLCEDCSYLGLSLENSQGFNHPIDPCKHCTCQLGNVFCESVRCESVCTHPARSDQCCPVCEQCLYLGEIHNSGQQFTAQEDNCLQCTCQTGSVRCQRQVCLEPQCKKPVRRDGNCCFECPVCQFYGDQYNDEETFPHPEDSCKKCSCSGGRVSCSRQNCVSECSHPRPDPCCPVCEECYFEGELLGNGETFHPDPCRTCLCTNGNVVCDTKVCPELDCLKSEVLPEECCPRCTGCMYEGRHYEEGSDWILQENACVSCMCSNGVITCDEVSCLTMCDDPIRIQGQCCPVCPTCKYNGVSYEDGDVFNPNGDPCDVCNCMKGHLRCIHETCANVNHCPSEQIIPAKPGVCCPKCSGFGTNCTRQHLGMTLKPREDDPCFVCQCEESFTWICRKETCEALACPPSEQKPVPGQCCPQCPVCYVRRTNLYYHEGEEWQDSVNPCIVCACKDGSVQCSIVECPLLNCAPGERLEKPQGRCCQECISVRPQKCLYRGRVYEADEEWRLDECTSCSCTDGEANCEIEECPPLSCQPDESPSLSPGLCCPVCLAKPATCMVFGDPHYKTFDGTTYHFQGTCKYVMATDCEAGDFSVEVHHDDRGVEEKVSWAQNITLRLADYTVELLQNHVVKANGQEVTLPYFQQPVFYVERSENTILLNTNIGVKFSWDGESSGELSVPGTYQRRLCGLCGNFNGFPQDDMKTRQGRITSSPAVFGNSWKVNSACVDAEDIDPCAKAGYRAKKIANVKCSIIKSALFARCHRVVSPEPFFSSCVFDMCVCSDEADCLCKILASYAHECAKAQVKLNWRSASLCAIGCPEGFIFDECGPPCPRTCENKDTPLGNIEAYCFKPCIPGCQCAAGKVVHDGKCIHTKQCP